MFTHKDDVDFNEIVLDVQKEQLVLTEIYFYWKSLVWQKMTFCLFSLLFCNKAYFTANVCMSLVVSTWNAGFRLNTWVNGACNCCFLQQAVTNDDCTYRLYIRVRPHLVTWLIMAFDWSFHKPYDVNFHPTFCLLTSIVWCFS